MRLRTTFDEQPRLAAALAGVLLAVAALVIALLLSAARPAADLNLAGRAVDELAHAEQLTLREQLDPESYASAVNGLAPRVSLYLNSDSARREPAMATRIARARLAYVAAYRIWLAEDTGRLSTVGRVPVVHEAIATFPELNAQVAASGASFRDPDEALNVLWAIGADETDAAAAALDAAGYRRWVSLGTAAPAR